MISLDIAMIFPEVCERVVVHIYAQSHPHIRRHMCYVRPGDGDCHLILLSPSMPSRKGDARLIWLFIVKGFRFWISLPTGSHWIDVMQKEIRPQSRYQSLVVMCVNPEIHFVCHRSEWVFFLFFKCKIKNSCNSVDLNQRFSNGHCREEHHLAYACV